jgi:hypothetical protein
MQKTEVEIRYIIMFHRLTKIHEQLEQHNETLFLQEEKEGKKTTMVLLELELQNLTNTANEIKKTLYGMQCDINFNKD